MYPPHDMPYGPPGTEVMMPYPPPTYTQPPSGGTKANSQTQVKHVPLAPRPIAPTAEKPKAGSDKQSDPSSESKKSTPAPTKPEGRPDPAAVFLNSSQKTKYISSPKPAPTLDMRLKSPDEEMNVHGMTPLSNLRGTFESLYGNGGMNVFSELSPEDNMSLNKALFADETDGRKDPMTPKTPMMKFAIGMSGGSLNASCIKNMQVNRVSISPVATKGSRLLQQTAEKAPKSAMRDPKTPGTISRSIHFADETDPTTDNIAESASKIYKLMHSDYSDGPSMHTTPFKTHTPMNISQSSGTSKTYSGRSPFAASMTPIGYDWGRQLGFSPDNTTVGSAFTPFRSPSASFELSTSVKRTAHKDERYPLADIDVHGGLPKSSEKQNDLAKRTKEQNRRPSPAKRHRQDIPNAPKAAESQ
jgi:hypothetical protein